MVLGRRVVLLPLMAAALGTTSLAAAQTPTQPPPIATTPSAPLPPTSPPPVQTAPAAAASELVPVHIESPEPVDLEVQDKGKWVPVCTSPCDRAVPTKENYRINGAGIRSSKPFRVNPGSAVKLEVEPTSAGGRTAAIIVTVTGGIGIIPVIGVSAMLVGGLLFGFIIICPLVDAFTRTSFGGCLGDIASEIGKYYAKPYVWIPGVVGVAMVAGGGAWLAATPATRVQVNQNHAPAPATPPSGGQQILKRVPEWRDARASLPDPPPAFVVPLVRGTF